MVSERIPITGFDTANYPELYQRLLHRFPFEQAREVFTTTVHCDLVKYSQEHLLWQNLFGKSAQFSISHYEYTEETDPHSGVKSIRPTPDTGEDMLDTLWRYAATLRADNDPLTLRAVAEYMGFASLRKILFEAPNYSLACWASPPWERNGYSVTYFAQVIPVNVHRRKIACTALNNDLTNHEHAAVLKAVNPQVLLDKNPSSLDIITAPVVTPASETVKDLFDLQQAVATKVKELRGRRHFFGNEIAGLKEFLSSLNDHWLQKYKEALRPFSVLFLNAVESNSSKSVLDRIFHESREAVLRIAKPELLNVGHIPVTLFQHRTNCPTKPSRESSIEKLLVGDKISCPGCGKLVIRGSEKCQHCGTLNEGCGNHALTF